VRLSLEMCLLRFEDVKRGECIGEVRSRRRGESPERRMIEGEVKGRAMVDRGAVELRGKDDVRDRVAARRKRDDDEDDDEIMSG